MEARERPQAANGAAIAALIGGILALLLILAAGLFEGSAMQGMVIACLTIAVIVPAYSRARSTGVGLGLTVAAAGLVSAALLLPLVTFALVAFGQG